MILFDLFLYGAAGWGAAVVATRHSASLKKMIPSKTLKGSPEDIEPSAIAANIFLTKIIKDIREEGRKYVTSNTSDCFEYEKKGDKIRLYTTGYFNHSGKISPGKILMTLRSKGNYIQEEFDRGSKTSSDLHKTVRSIQDLLREVEKQKAKEVANAAAFKVIEALTPKPTPEPEDCFTPCFR